MQAFFFLGDNKHLISMFNNASYVSFIFYFFHVLVTTSYYDTLLMNYQNLVKERGWKQPLLGMQSSVSIVLCINLLNGEHDFIVLALICFAVALSYSVQILDEHVIPVAPYDIPIDALVSPSGLILISETAFQRCQ